MKPILIQVRWLQFINSICGELLRRRWCLWSKTFPLDWSGILLKIKWVVIVSGEGGAAGCLLPYRPSSFHYKPLSFTSSSESLHCEMVYCNTYFPSWRPANPLRWRAFYDEIFTLSPRDTPSTLHTLLIEIFDTIAAAAFLHCHRGPLSSRQHLSDALSSPPHNILLFLSLQYW